MKVNITTVIPVYNGEAFIEQTLESIARQTLRSERVIVQDNCSTDNTEKIVRGFKGLDCQFIRNERNLGLFGNLNRALQFAPETRYLHFICADDLVEPAFYQRLTQALDSCKGFGLGYVLDERIDENNQPLSLSGRVSDTVEEIPVDAHIAQKAEIGNQAFSGTLLKLDFQPSPVEFRLDMPILADMVFWGAFGRHCQRIVRLNLPLCKYRWHGLNTTNVEMSGLDALIRDEWRCMQMNEQLRAAPAGFVRRFKLKGLFAVRTGVKAKRIRQQGNAEYSRAVVAEGKKTSGLLAWYMGQGVVEARDLMLYGLLRRRRHPRNIYS